MEKIKCPKCNHEFSPDEFFKHENDKHIQKAIVASEEKMAKKLADKDKEIDSIEEKMAKQLAKQLADYDKYNRYKKKEIEKKIKKRLPKKMKI